MEKLNVYAKREIIVSDGQWMTPQLLQLRGIGDQSLLTKFGSETIPHIPAVGKNIRDRNEMTYIVKLMNDSNILAVLSSTCTFGATSEDPCYLDYLKNPRTSFYSTNLVLASMLHSKDPQVPNLPDTTYPYVPLRFTGFRENWVSEALSYGVGTYLTVCFNTARLLDKLRSVEIQSSNPFDIPPI